MRSVRRLRAVLTTSLTALLVLAVQTNVAEAASVCPSDKAGISPCRCFERFDEVHIWCSHGDLNDLTSALKTIGQSVRLVDELILENNLLPSLPGQFFSSMQVLRLMLRDNGLQRVSANWLAGTESTMQEIYIVEPELHSFPDESLITLPKLEALTLSGGLISKMPAIFGLSRLRYIQIEATAMNEAYPNNFQGLPFLEQLHLTSAPRIQVLHEGFVHDLPKLSLLNFTHCGLTYVHSRALQRLPSVTEITFTSNRFTDARLVGMAIRDLPYLHTVRLDQNSIVRLDEGSFVDIPSLRNLYLNDNKITHIHRAAFHRLPRLRSLDLSNNLIRIVHPESFLPPRELPIEDLWLNNNLIEHTATLRTLVETLPDLRLLDFSNNLLEEITYGTVANHLHLEMLILENNRIQRLGREAFISLPSLRELKLANNSINYHIGTPYWNLPALKGLDLSRNNFEHIDRYLLNGLPSLRRFDMSGNALRSIEPASFIGSPFLEHVNISRNNLQLLSPLTFIQLQKLFDLDVSYNNLSQGISGMPVNIEYMYMAGNNIMAITPSGLQEFQHTSLKLLDLSHNKIHKIPVTSLNTLCSLRTLLLNDNLLQVIDQAPFETLPQLRKLDLSNNKLILVKKDSFKKLQHLAELNLGRNRLEVFEADLLSQNPDLRKLDISANQLTEIPSSAFSNNKKIEDLNLSENLLTDFPSSIAGLSALQTLKLSRNQMRTLPSNMLPSLPALKEIYLSGNKFRELSSGVFERLTNLSIIDLENNKIERVDSHALRSLPNLVVAKMAKNKISSISRSAFDELPALQSVELQENQLQDVADEAFTACPSLLMVNMSHNRLQGVEKAGINNLKTLEALDLSHNRITKLSGDSVRDMNFLILLKLDNNKLCNIEGTPFEKMSRLRMLSLRDNKITSLAEPTFSKLRSSILYFDIEGNPVKCSCNMLWLQSWLQQDDQRYPGPRCSDGILLRDHRITKNNCDDVVETVPGCDNTGRNSFAVEVLPNLTTAASNISIVTTTSKPQSYLKPLPEETDYFDPKFIELESNYTRSPKSTSTISPDVLSHFISGDTPTLYAGTRTKPSNANRTIAGSSSPSPPPPQGSSSAFTFFGMPIPSLNLNNFWNSGKSFDKSHKKHGRHNLWPPSQPDIQKDGFVPMLPGHGGFVPMNTTPSTERNASTHAHRVTGLATIAKVSLPPRNPADETDDIVIESPRTNRNVTHDDPLPEMTSTNTKTITTTTAAATTTTSTTTTTKTARSTTTTISITEQPKPVVSSASERIHYHGYANASSNMIKNSTADSERRTNTTNAPVPLGHMSTVPPAPGQASVSKVQLLNAGPLPHAEDAHSSHLRLAKSSLHSSTSPQTSSTPASPAPQPAMKESNDSKNWYFINYNRSNIEPYVGHIPIKVSRSLQYHPWLPLILVGLSLIFVT